MNPRGSFKEVVQVSWPLMVGMLSFTIMDVTGTLMVGRLGTRELAAVGMSTSVMFLINSFFIGFFESVKILVSQAMGAKQQETAQIAGWQGLFLAIPMGFAVIGLTYLGPILFSFFGSSESLRALTEHYFGLRLWATPFWFVTLVLSSYFQGTGNTRLPMRINLFMCLFNVVVNQILIFGLGPIPAFGIDGSAYSTILCDFGGMVVILVAFLKRVDLKPQIHLPMIRKLFSLGVPVGIRWLLDTGGWTFVVGMIARLGEVPLAANQIATKIMCLSLLPVYGISEAACILAGQSVGAGDIPALKRSYWATLQLSVGIMIITGLIFALSPGPLVRLFQNNSDVLLVASEVLMLVGCYQVLSALSLVTAGVLNGTGDTRFTMVLLILSSWFVMVPGAYLLGIHMELGVFGMWLSLIAHETVLVIGTQWRFHSGRWRNHLAI
ncbi:MAG: MATE family efflux transporter [Myxococcaceae bacterium]|nr:MATE family efflux transporter [Myxococcaceae bacterium]MBH2006307.1 MATE family efflux transporter [Myxococcaceae bacterium]